MESQNAGSLRHCLCHREHRLKELKGSWNQLSVSGSMSFIVLSLVETPAGSPKLSLLKLRTQTAFHGPTVTVLSTTTHGHCLQWPHINMHGCGIKEIPLANLSGLLQGQLATSFGSIPVTQIPASGEFLQKRLAMAPWGLNI